MNYISGSANVADSAKLEAPVRLYGTAKLGKNTKIGKFSYINTNSTVNSGTTIGRFCSVGKNVEIGPFDHPLERLSTSPVSYNMKIHFPDYTDMITSKKLVRRKAPVIGNDVWFGSHSIVMRGVRIGNGAVIGAGALVTKDVAPYSVVVGTPARHVRYRFPEDICKDLNDLAWWDLPADKLAKVPFDDVYESIWMLKDIRSDMKKDG
ncbi:CatB-related O-acetyltransferase [Loktanella salsilacus]|uniref:CatB-related O-acetyltransferase n=1 Tax=Loktanella salsilacus TaxID=195913 RepID=UPI003735EDE1